VKLLLTSAGVKNASIKRALVDLLGKPIEACDALCIPTAMHGHPMVGPGVKVWEFICGREPRTPMCELGWNSVGVLELAALPTIDPAVWVPKVRAADVFLVAGGDAGYLAHWIHESGFGAELASLPNTVWVGLSAGSMVATPRIGSEFVGWTLPGNDRNAPDNDRTMGWVDFSIFPHLGHPELPHNQLANAERWAAAIGGPCYAIDDETAIVVDNGKVEVVSEGVWKIFP